MRNSFKKKYFLGSLTAFTLAEILIVLGIIGIIAEMTIPTLINNVDKVTYVTELKKFYTTQMDGYAQMMANEGVEKLDDTEAFQAMGSGMWDFCQIDAMFHCDVFVSKLQKYFRVRIEQRPSHYNVTTLNGAKYGWSTPSSGGPKVIAFADGAMLINGQIKNTAFDRRTQSYFAKAIKDSGGHEYAEQGYFTVDVNGAKGPNIIGRDVFTFSLSGDGKLYPSGGRDYSLYAMRSLAWYWKQEGYYGCGSSSDNSGSSCAGRIMEDGWAMNY